MKRVTSVSSRGRHKHKRETSKDDNAPTVSDGSWSPLGGKLLEKWAWGQLSVKTLILNHGLHCLTYVC